jgi:outer membrane receptor protein involved in Fe transport
MEDEAMALRYKLSSFCGLFLIVLFVLGSRGALSLHAQAIGGTILGVVTDPSGGAVPNVEISIANTATGLVTKFTTTAEGFYSVPNLLPGPYQVTAKSAGFSTAVVNGITLTVGAQQSVNIALKVGETSQQVEVTSTALSVELASSTLSDVVSGSEVRDMPLNGRSWTDLAQLQPGVNAVHTQAAASTSDRASRGWGTALSVSGARPTSNNYTLNGISLNDNMNTAPGSFLAGNLGVDSIGEFSVLTGNFSAQYGKSAGGMINAITKSGTNEFHGSAYEFLRNSAMDAKNFFDPAGPISPFRRNQFGASAGGPIQKDKTFVFGDYEGLRQSLSLSQVVNVPSAAARAGNLCSPPNCATTHTIMDPTLGLQDSVTCATPGNPSNCTYPLGGPVPPGNVTCNSSTNVCTAPPPFAINPNVAAFLPLWPLPNGQIICPFASCVSGAGDTGLYAFSGSQVTPENFATVRLDRKIGDKDNLFGTFLIDRQSQSQSDSLGDMTTSRSINRQTWTVEDSHTFSPSLINVVRVGYNRQSITSPSGATALNPIAADTTLGIASGQTIGRIVVGGLTAFQGGLTLWQSAHSTWNSFQESDDLFIIKGIHSLKFGFALERDQLNTAGPGGFAGGWSTFSNYPNFLDGSPSSLIANSGVGDLSTHPRQWVWGAYAQDDVRLTPHLTINAGLRYEYAANMTTHHSGTLANLECQACPFPIMQAPLTYNPPLQAIVNQYDPAPVYGPIINVPRLNFEPRVGFAWDPFGNGKTAVRGAFGVYDVLLTFYAQEATDWPGLQSSNSGTIPVESWPKGNFSATSSDINSKRAFWQEHAPKTNYVMQWNLSVQHQFTNTLSVLVGYVGDKSIHNAFHFDDFNVIFPNLSSGVPLWQCGTLATAPGPGFDPTRKCPLFPNAANLAGINGPKTSTNPGGLDLIAHHINCCIGREPGRIWNGYGYYEGLQVAVQKALGHGLSLQGSYTFSTNIDTSSGTTIGDPYVNSISSSLYYWDNKLRTGLSDTNIRHNLVVSFSYQVPTPPLGSEILKAITGGWQTGGILTVQSGQPMTALISGDAIGEGNSDPISYPNRLGGPGCQSLVNPGNVQNYIKVQCFAATTPVLYQGSYWLTGGNLGRNSIPGPGLGTLDLSLFKNNYIKRISESFNAQFRFEAFNVFNRPNFSPPTDNEYLFDQKGVPIPGAGAIDLTTTTSRQLQVALKIIW